MPYRPKHILEHIALRATCGCLRILPYRLALLNGWVIAWIAFYIFRFRVRIALDRIHAVFGKDVSNKKAKRIAWISWRNFVFSIIEMIRMDKMSRDWIERKYRGRETVEFLAEHARSGQGALVATCHMGSWEMAAVRCHLNNIPVFTVAATQKNPLTDTYINALRRAPGIDTIARGSGTMKSVIRRLKDGKMLAILPDVRVRGKGITVSFLGGKAKVGDGLGRLSRQTNVPIIPVMLTRKGWSHHKMHLNPPIRPDKTLDKNQDVARMTAATFGIIEDAIRTNPEQWFWFNKRWILDQG